jgi:rubrerythrin
MVALKGTKTEKNLMAAFAGESQARNRYTYFAGQAKKDGFEQIAAIFLETADHEKEHAKRLFKFMEGGETEITGSFPAGVVGATLDNLMSAAGGEDHEQSEMYPSFAKVARQEGFETIARVFESIAVAERFHEKRFLALAENIRQGRVFKRQAQTAWKCRNCGYIHTGEEAPEVCPACHHPRAHYEVMVENW